MLLRVAITTISYLIINHKCFKFFTKYNIVKKERKSPLASPTCSTVYFTSPKEWWTGHWMSLFEATGPPPQYTPGTRLHRLHSVCPGWPWCLWGTFPCRTLGTGSRLSANKTCTPSALPTCKFVVFDYFPHIKINKNKCPRNANTISNKI